MTTETKGGKTWEPTPEELAAFKSRETQNAAANLARCIGTTVTMEDGTIRPFCSQDLLHSKATLFAGMQLHLETKPNRFTRDPRQFGSTPRERRAATA